MREDDFEEAFKDLMEIATSKNIIIWFSKPREEWDWLAPIDELERGNIEGVVNLMRMIIDGEGGF